MEKHEDGSITLTGEEIAELRDAYVRLFDVLGSFPASMQDFFGLANFIAIGKWYEQLQGRKFVRSDWIGEEE